MKKYNLKETNIVILKHIINNPGMSRIELSKEFNLNRSTISYITKQLEEDNYIYFKRGVNKNNRTGNYIYFNYDYEDLLLIELSKESLKVILMDLSNNIKMRNDYDIKDIDIYSLLTSLLKDFKNVKAAIFAIHGTIDYSNTVIKSPFYDLSISKIYDIFQSNNIEVIIENEANLYSLGCYEKKINSMLIDIHISDGVGSGLVLNGELFKGYSGIAGEIGHTIVEIDGRECRCGNKGCLETYVSDYFTLLECRQKLLVNLNYDNFKDYYKSEKIVKEIIDRNISYMIKMINDLSAILNPDQINITSKLYSQIEGIEKLLSKNLTSKVINVPNIKVVNYNEENLLKGSVKILLRERLKLKGE